MHFKRLLFLLTTTLVVSGCDNYGTPPTVLVDRLSGNQPDPIDVQADAARPQFAEQPQLPTPRSSGGVAVDVAPDPAQRRYVYDPGFPPGTYAYSGYYYYAGYRYPEESFVSGYVQDNIQQQRFVNTAQNRAQAQKIAAQERAAAAANSRAQVGATNSQTAKTNEPRLTPRSQSASPNLERHEVTAPAAQPNVRQARDPADTPGPNAAQKQAIERAPTHGPSQEPSHSTIESPAKKAPAEPPKSNGASPAREGPK